MSFSGENQPLSQSISQLPPQSSVQVPVPHYVDCLEAQTFDELCARLEKIPLTLRIGVYEALHLHFQSLKSKKLKTSLPNTEVSPKIVPKTIANYFSDISLCGIFFSTFKESSATISHHVEVLLQQSTSDKFKQQFDLSTSDKFKEQFCLIPFNLRAQVHAASFQKALWCPSQMLSLSTLNISTDLYGTDIQLTEADLQTSHFQNSLFDAVDEFNFISQFRQIPLQCRTSVHKVLLHTVQHSQQSAEFSGWVSTIQATDLYLDFDDIAKGISEEAHIYANACFTIPSWCKTAEVSFLELPLAIGGQVYQAICFKSLMLHHHSYHPFVQHKLAYLQHKPGQLRHQLLKLLNAPNYHAFLTQFLSLDRSRRIQIHNDLHFYTKSDLVKYKEQFGWVLQCIHPYYFVRGFDDDLESESNQAVKCAHDFLVNPGHRDAIFAQFAQFTEQSRFKFCLTLGSKATYEWISSHVDLQRYIDPLYPELVSATEEVKECVGHCILASGLGEFKVAFHSIPFALRHQVYGSLSFYKDYYYKKQQDFLNSLSPFEISVDVNSYISDDQLMIYANVCLSEQTSQDIVRRVSSIPYPIRVQIYKLTLTQAKRVLFDSVLHYSKSLWEVSPRAGIDSTPKIDECLSSDSFDQFKSRFLSIPRQSRLGAYEALYVKTQNNQLKFIWLLQCSHPYYFVDEFDDNLESESNKAREFKFEFSRFFTDSPDSHSGPIFTKFTQLSPSSQFDIFLTFSSQLSSIWISSCPNFEIYTDWLFPDVVSDSIELKKSLFDCLVAKSFAAFETKFFNLPIQISNTIVRYKDHYPQQQKDWIAVLQLSSPTPTPSSILSQQY